MLLSPVQPPSERRRGKGGQSLANRTGVGRVAEIVVEIEAGKTAKLPLPSWPRLRASEHRAATAATIALAIVG
jgi:hypothetical protein